MSYAIEIKETAISLRNKGYSIKEIAKILNIAKSTSSAWLSSIKLNNKAQLRLRKRKILGQYRAIELRRKKNLLIKEKLNNKIFKLLKKINLSKDLNKLLCSILFWTEGSKTTNYLSFINSDPAMIKTFLKLLRSSFGIKEKSLRALVHIHEYHNNEEVKKFWSKVTKIPLSQFSKSYLKPNTKKRIRDGYKGSIRIRYYDSKVALELQSFYNTFAQII